MARVILILISFLYSIQLWAVTGHDIRKREMQILDQAQKLKDVGHSAGQFYEKIIKKLDQDQSPDRVKTLNADDLGFLDQWEQDQSHFLQLRLQTIAEKQWYFINFVHQNLSELMEQKSSWTKWRKKKSFAHINDLFKEWNHAAKDTFKEGIDQDHQKAPLYSFDNYFTAVSQLLYEVGHAPKPPQDLKYPKWAAYKLASKVLGRNWFPSCSTQAKKNCTPVTGEDGAVGFFKKWTRKEKLEIDLVGKENLDGIPLNGASDGKVVNLFLPAHRTGIVDGMMMSQLSLPHFLIFANPSAFIKNKFLAQKLASLREFIGVAKLRGKLNLTPNKKLLEALQDELSPNVLNYPQGFVSNTGEILPIHARFVEKLLCPLITNDYRVNIIPVAYEADSEFLTPSHDLSRSHYTVKILAPFFSSSVEKLVRMQLGISDTSKDCTPIPNKYSRILDHLLLSTWYENIETYRELTLDQLLERAQKRLAIPSDLTWGKEESPFSEQAQGFVSPAWVSEVQ